MRLVIAFTLLSLLLFNQQAFGWGWDGHRLICAVAESRLTPEARRMVNQYLAEGADLKAGVVNFPDACVWPDDVKYSTRKSTYEHHFINVPDDATTIDLNRDCSATNCIAVGVQQALNYLHKAPNGKRDITRRAAALRFLGHYIGDLHQPLHIGNASDWGGNKVTVTWLGKASNIHAIWDYKMMDTMGLKYPDGLDFLKSAKAQKTDGRVIDWMNRSLQLARSHAYVNADGTRILAGDALGMDYLNQNKAIIIERLAQASARLANLLNDIAAGHQPVAFFIAAPASGSQ